MFGNPRDYDNEGECPLLTSEVSDKAQAQNAERVIRLEEIEKEIVRLLGPLKKEEKQIIEQNRTTWLELGKEAGFIATQLEDLRAADGSSFTLLQSSYGEVKRARAANREIAYLCQRPRSQTPEGCGWVKGRPKAKGYDNIAPMSGSAGVNHFCCICGMEIGTTVLEHS